MYPGSSITSSPERIDGQMLISDAVDWHRTLRDSGDNERDCNGKAGTDDENDVAHLVAPA